MQNGARPSSKNYPCVVDDPGSHVDRCWSWCIAIFNPCRSSSLSVSSKPLADTIGNESSSSFAHGSWVWATWLSIGFLSSNPFFLCLVVDSWFCWVGGSRPSTLRLVLWLLECLPRYFLLLRSKLCWTNCRKFQGGGLKAVWDSPRYLGCKPRFKQKCN